MPYKINPFTSKPDYYGSGDESELYIGKRNTAGSWRISISGGTLDFAAYDGASYVSKMTLNVSLPILVVASAMISFLTVNSLQVANVLQVDQNLYVAGNVGIGVGNTAPRAKLDVDGSTYLRGNVGIGTSAPIAKLNIDGSAYIGGVFYPEIQTAQKEPTGFLDRTATLSWSDATRTLTITGTHTIYVNGKKYDKTTSSKQIANTTGLHFIYYDTSGVLQESVTFPGMFVPLMASVYWNATYQKGLAADERHGIVMDGQTHNYLHVTVGTRYQDGLAGTFTPPTFALTNGDIWDEDLQFTVTAPTTDDVIYYNGASTFYWDANQTTFYKMNGSKLRYNNSTTLSDVGSNKYVAMWIFATNSITRPIVTLIGQREDTVLSDAIANNTYASLALDSLPFAEMKILYRVILRNVGATPTVADVQDLRSISNLSSGSYVATAHNALTGLNWSVSGHTFDTALNTGSQNILTTGNVGIGTSVPRQMLDVEGSVYMKGNVGIGTSAPRQLLDVAGETTVNNLTVNGTAAAAISAPTSGSGTIHAGTGDYNDSSNIDNHIIRIYSYKTVGANTYYSSDYLEVAADTTGIDIYHVDWSWNAVPGVTGYRLIKYMFSTAEGFSYENYDFYKDVITNSLADTGHAVWTFGSKVTPKTLYSNTVTINGDTTLEGEITVEDNLTAYTITADTVKPAKIISDTGYASVPNIKLVGKGDAENGMAIFLNYNGSGNRQLAIGDSTGFGSDSGRFFRYWDYAETLQISGVDGTNSTNLPISIGPFNPTYFGNYDGSGNRGAAVEAKGLDTEIAINAQSGSIDVDSDNYGLKLGDDQDVHLYANNPGSLNIEPTALNTDMAVYFLGTTNSGYFKWMEDEDYFLYNDGILMSSTEEIFFRDTAINIKSTDDGHIDITADVSIDLNGTVYASGNVGIGTSAPTAKLAIDGSIYVKKPSCNQLCNSNGFFGCRDTGSCVTW